MSNRRCVCGFVHDYGHSVCREAAGVEAIESVEVSGTRSVRMSETDEAVGRVQKELDRQRSWGGMAWVDAPRVSVPTEALRTLLAALARVTEELSAANAHIALLEGEGHTGCNERIFQLESDLATLRERLAGEVGALKMAERTDHGFCGDDCDACVGNRIARNHNAALDRAVAVIRGEGT